MRKITKKELIKYVKEMLDKNRIRLTSVSFKSPEYKLMSLTSDGKSVEQAITDGILTITFKPKILMKYNK